MEGGYILVARGILVFLYVMAIVTSLAVVAVMAKMAGGDIQHIFWIVVDTLLGVFPFSQKREL